ncbi:MAG: hypothetical protein ACTTH5_08550 [Wolinella sp.]
MNELIKNIGLGLFVNGTYALLNGDFTLMPMIITAGSTFIMYSAIRLEQASLKQGEADE